jgi:MFS family permease
MVFAPGGWTTFLFMITASVGYVLLLPIGTGVVSSLAPLRIRGRYLGVWTFVFLAGYSLGPLLGGLVVTALGPQPAYLIVAATGVAAAALLLLLRPALRHRAARLTDRTPA